MDAFPGFDTIPSSLHRYSYVANSPINEVDPSGLTNLAENVTTVQVQGIVSVSIQTVRVNTAIVAANDALWVVAATSTGAATSTAISPGVITALALAAAATEVDRFLGVPVIVFGGEFPGHALHIGEAQYGMGSNGRPISPAVNRVLGWDRDWLNKTPECNVPARRAAGGGKACDEYPFATSRQGGPLGYMGWGVSLRLLDGNESSRTGPFIGGFYNHAAILPDGLSKLSRYLVLGIPGSQSFYTDRLGRVHYWGK